MSKFITILLTFYFLSADLSGDEVTLSGGFLPYETYYIGAVDLATGSSDVQIFNFLLSSPNNTPIEFHAQFTVDILAPELGFRTKEKLIELNTTSPIAMTHPIYLDNRDFNINSTKILDTHGNNVSMAFAIEGEFDIAEYEGLLNAIVSMGRLPDGIYDFTLKLYDFSGGQEDIIKIETINITTPTSLNLIYPGGSLADTAQNLVYTPYPVFQWSTETCSACGLFIRVAEFDPEVHSSPGEAIEDITSLPLDQVEGWYNITDASTSFPYPVVGARELEGGKLYAWQIKKELPTTLGTDAYLSPISVFKLVDSSSSANSSSSTQLISEPILIALKDLLGETTFDAYFGVEGEFSNHLPSGTYRINNESTTSNDILQIIDQLQQGTISIVNISFE